MDEPRQTTAAVEALRKASNAVVEHSLDRIGAELEWYRTLPEAERRQIEAVARHGVTMFINWLEDPEHAESPAKIFSVAPAALTGSVTLSQTLALVRHVIDVVQEEAPDLVPAAEHDHVRYSVLIFGRDIGFAAAEVYGRAAEARGAWDARLESVAVDALLHDSPEVVVTRAGTAGWHGHGSTIAVAARVSLDALGASRLRHECRTGTSDCLVSVRGDSVLIVLGASSDDPEAVSHLTATAQDIARSLEGPAVIGPITPGIETAGISLRSAMAGLRALPAWPQAPQPIRSDDLFPERLLDHDILATDQIIERVYTPLHDLGDLFEETVATYLALGGSLEATARTLFVHANTVRYRLGRVSDQLGWDATDPRDGLVLHLAIIAGRLAHRPTR